MNLLKIVRKVITIGILIVIPVITHALPARSPDFWTCPFCHALKAKVPGVVEVGTCLLDTLHHGDFGLSFVLAGHCSYFAQVKKSMQSHLESSKLWKAPKRGLDREHTSGILFISVKFQNVWDTQSSQPDFTGIYCLNWQIMETMDYKYKYKYMHITNSMIYIYIYVYTLWSPWPLTFISFTPVAWPWWSCTGSLKHSAIDNGTVEWAQAAKGRTHFRGS